MRRRFHFIANPISGTRDRRAMVAGLVADLTRRGHRADVSWTAAAGDAVGLARDADADVVVAVGGDGTVTEVAQGLRGRDVALGVVPADTANVLARELGLWRLRDDAAAVLARGNERRLDGGLCNGARFLLMVGVGLDGVVAHAHTRAQSGHNSYWRYVQPVWTTVRDMRLAPLRITVDGVALPDGCTTAIAGNVRGFGGVFEATSNAEPDDGLLDVVALSGRSRLRWTAYLFAALSRRLHEFPGVHTARGTHVVVEPADGETAVPMQRDGDPCGFTPADISLEPGAVRVIVP